MQALPNPLPLTSVRCWYSSSSAADEVHKVSSSETYEVNFCGGVAGVNQYQNSTGGSIISLQSDAYGSSSNGSRSSSVMAGVIHSANTPRKWSSAHRLPNRQQDTAAAKERYTPTPPPFRRCSPLSSPSRTCSVGP